MFTIHYSTRMFHVYKCQNLDVTYSKPICRIISDYSTYESENHYCNVELNIYKMLLNVHISVTVSMCRSTHMSQGSICLLKYKRYVQLYNGYIQIHIT